jgi:hypothetical protein
MFALDSLRLEKGYRAWKGDLSTDYTVLQAGLERFVDWTKPDFKGRAALMAEREAGPKRRFATLVVEAGDCDAPYMSTVWQGGQVVGETTSGGWGHRVDKSIALPWSAPTSPGPAPPRGRDLRRTLPRRGPAGRPALGPHQRTAARMTRFICPQISRGWSRRGPRPLLARGRGGRAVPRSCEVEA